MDWLLVWLGLAWFDQNWVGVALAGFGWARNGLIRTVCAGLGLLRMAWFDFGWLGLRRQNGRGVNSLPKINWPVFRTQSYIDPGISAAPSLLH